MNRFTAWVRRLKFSDLIPFIAFIVIFLFFTFASYNDRTGTFQMLTGRNLTTIVSQAMITIIVATGTLFVVAQGSTDLSVGVNLALSAVIGSYVAEVTGIGWLLIPVALIVGLIIGVFNGVMVSRFKISSFMLTLAMLIGVRGLVNYLQVYTDVQSVPSDLSFMTNTVVQIIIFVVILAIMFYVFEFTKIGRYSRAIGENEVTSRFIGIPTNRIKIIAFALSGLMAAVGAIFYIGIIGGTTNQMGSFLEIRVIMGIYLGGVLVTGGTSAKFYKILLGSFSIQIIITGLSLMGLSDVQYSQSVEGLLLLLILILTVVTSSRRSRHKEHQQVSNAVSDSNAVEGK